MLMNAKIWDQGSITKDNSSTFSKQDQKSNIASEHTRTKVPSNNNYTGPKLVNTEVLLSISKITRWRKINTLSKEKYQETTKPSTKILQHVPVLRNSHPTH